MSTGFGLFIVFWSIILLGFMLIGGYFMFRKFLKSMPKQDGMSDLDWQDHYIDETRSMWDEETLRLLDELVEPVPELFRDVARRSIAAKIGKLALDQKASKISQDLIIRGYIMATPARDHKWLIEHLTNKGIDFSAYNSLLKVSSKS